MKLADVDALQDDLYGADDGIGEMVTVRTTGQAEWTGDVIRTTPDNLENPPGGLGRAAGVLGFAFSRNRPVLLVGISVIEDADGNTYRVNEIDDSGGERVVVTVAEA